LFCALNFISEKGNSITAYEVSADLLPFPTHFKPLANLELISKNLELFSFEVTSDFTLPHPLQAIFSFVTRPFPASIDYVIVTASTVTKLIFY
jgi:hypothetical protein